MKQSIYLSDFQDAFRDMGRPENFSYEALELLYNMLEELDENYELDVIAICCDYSEYKNIEELQGDYGTEYTMENLIDMTTVISIENTEGFIIQQF